GTMTGACEAYVKRTLDKRNGLIVEHVINLETGKEPQEYIVDMKVSGNRFSLVARNGSFSGSGLLTGEPWNWNSWTSETLLQGGSKVVSEDGLKDGNLEVRKQFISPDGKPRVLFVESYRPLSAEQFDALHEKLFPAGGK
ncbi:MAG: hypothetical protein PHQ23_17130, partial [Candidatus Wallbacteria bacterium]|nr:hypothetical protein [Candidatus Wallbacteria bacterium]